MSGHIGEYYKCDYCNHIWDYPDSCPDCGTADVYDISAEDANEHIRNLPYGFDEHKLMSYITMLECNGDYKED